MVDSEIFCKKLGRFAQRLTVEPYPGVLGQRIVEGISAEAWQLWLARQTMLINENRWNPCVPDNRVLLEKAMVSFLFDQADVLPEGYTQPGEVG
jgi:Fe-S cluster biosynthesis and repair protein YggX